MSYRLFVNAEGGEVSYRLFVNAERTVMLRLWDDGTMEVACRDDPGDVWGPPVTVEEEQ